MTGVQTCALPISLLVQQAALAFAYFTDIVPDAALCRDILQELEAAQ